MSRNVVIEWAPSSESAQKRAAKFDEFASSTNEMSGGNMDERTAKVLRQA